jgi:hypothetical protein
MSQPNTGHWRPLLANAGIMLFMRTSSTTSELCMMHHSFPAGTTLCYEGVGHSTKVQSAMRSSSKPNMKICKIQHASEHAYHFGACALLHIQVLHSRTVTPAGRQGTGMIARWLPEVAHTNMTMHCTRHAGRWCCHSMRMHSFLRVRSSQQHVAVTA